VVTFAMWMMTEKGVAFTATVAVLVAVLAELA
jgi:hypothetical protein